MIDYVFTERQPIFALLIDGKNERGDLSPAQRRVLAGFGGRDEAWSRDMTDTDDTEFGRALVASMQEAVAIVSRKPHAVGS